LTYGASVAVLPYRQPSGPDVVTATVDPPAVQAGELVTLSVGLDDGRTIDDPIFGREPVQPIAAAAYTVDAPPWCGAAGSSAPLDPADSFDTSSEGASAVIDTRGWTPGRHTIFIQGTDAGGNRGPASAVFLDVGEEQTSQAKECLFSIYLPIWMVDKTEVPAEPTAAGEAAGEVGQ